MATSDRPKSIGIIGGGISGLATAAEILQKSPATQVTIFEKESIVGGLLKTSTIDGCLVEKSADMFSTKLPGGLDLCRESSFLPQLIPTSTENRGAVLATNRSVESIPKGFSLIRSTLPKSVLQSPILSNAGKIRFLLEPLFAKHSPLLASNNDPSVEEFATQHWGREVFERIVQPLVSGIYTADPSKLSMKDALPEFFEQGVLGKSLLGPEPNAASSENLSDQGIQGSLGAGTNPNPFESQGARYGLFLAPKNGMGSWMEHIKKWLEEKGAKFHLNQHVQQVSKTERGWQVTFQRTQPASDPQTKTFDAVVAAGPSNKTAELIPNVFSELQTKLRSTPYAGIAIVIAIYRRESFFNNGNNLRFGLVVPHHLGSPLIATSFSTKKFEGRSPKNLILTRSFIGGALNPEAVDWPEEKILTTAHQELNRWIPVSLKPQTQFVVRYPSAMPQYHIGHSSRIDKIFELEKETGGLFLAGNGYRGVGIPQCVQSGKAAAGRTLKFLGI